MKRTKEIVRDAKRRAEWRKRKRKTRGRNEVMLSPWKRRQGRERPGENDKDFVTYMQTQQKEKKLKAREEMMKYMLDTQIK